jgi:hypothetical protein
MGSHPDVWDGECTGILNTLAFLSRRLPDPWKFCPPNNVNTEQAARIAVKYMEAHPEKLNLNFKVLAMLALVEAWPANERGPD